MLKLPVYMDYNATTPCDPRVVEAMIPYFYDQFGNAASHSHAYGWMAAEAVAMAREQVATLVGAGPEEIVFTSGATESINLAIKGVFELYSGKGNHVVTCVTEHKAVLDTCHSLERRGARVTYLPVNEKGALDLGELEAAITPETILVTVMAANNETGYLHPLSAISDMVHQKGCLLFSDATQAVGKVPFSVAADGLDLMACSAHKLYGPKGTGVLYVRRKNPRVRLQPQMDGGGHEKGFRSGTLNVPGIVGMGAACRLLGEQGAEASGSVTGLRDRLETALLALGGVRVNGDTLRRLPHVTNLAFEDVDGRQLLTAVTKKVAVSSGSACTSALPEPSHVLQGMGLSPALAAASLRFSLGRFTTAEEIDFVIKVLGDELSVLRAEG